MGQHLPSVTQVIYSFENNYFFTEISACRGTKVHSIVSEYLSGGWVPDSARLTIVSGLDRNKELIVENIHPFIESFNLWKATTKPVANYIEKRFFDEDIGFCGQPDFIGSLATNSGIGVVDWKTSIATNPLWEEQLAAYRYLVEKATGIDIAWSMSVRIRKNGALPLADVYDNREEYKEALEKFMSKLKMFKAGADSRTIDRKKWPFTQEKDPS